VLHYAQAPRIYGFGHLHFITFSCYRRLPLLGSAHARNVFVQIFNEVRDQFGFALVGYMHMNPVKRGLALRSRDWIWSSAEFYAGRESNTIRIDPVA
jgi:REP element-mobilizing transposase RayT